MVGAKTFVMWPINSGYNPNKQNPSNPPNDAVVAKAADSSLVNSFAILSYLMSPPLNPTISTITAKIGTPSTKAANMRCNSDTIQTTTRESIPKKVLYWTGGISSSSAAAVVVPASAADCPSGDCDATDAVPASN